MHSDGAHEAQRAFRTGDAAYATRLTRCRARRVRALLAVRQDLYCCLQKTLGLGALPERGVRAGSSQASAGTYRVAAYEQYLKPVRMNQ